MIPRVQHFSRKITSFFELVKPLIEFKYEEILQRLE